MTKHKQVCSRSESLPITSYQKDKHAFVLLAGKAKVLVWSLLFVFANCIWATGNLWAQCSFEFSQYCVPYSAIETNVSTQIRLTCNPGFVVREITTSPELRIISTTGLGSSSTSSIISCRAGSFCPGVLRAKVWDGNCYKIISQTVHKILSPVDVLPFAIKAFGQNGFEIETSNGQTCARPGDILGLRVAPLLSVCTTATDIYTWSFVDAAGNPLAGWTPVIRSGDNSAVTVRVPTSANFTQPCTVRVRVGTCAAIGVVHAQMIIQPNASPSDISLASGTVGTRIAPNPNLTAVDNFTYLSGTPGDRTWCLNADYGALLVYANWPFPSKAP